MSSEIRHGSHASEGQAERRQEVDAITGLREVLESEGQSSMRKYQALAVGKRGFWAFVKYELLTMLLGPLPGAMGYFLRKFFYRHLFRVMGRGVVIGRNVTVRHPHRIAIGQDVVIDDHAMLDGKGSAEETISIGDRSIVGRNTVLSCKDGTIRLGARVNLSVNCTVISESEVTIGDRVLVAGHCYFIGGGNHGIDRTDVPIVDQPRVHRGGVRIGENAWIGANVTVLDGVTVGRDAVVAAGAVVVREIPEFCVAGGVPAKVIRDRRRQEPVASASQA